MQKNRQPFVESLFYSVLFVFPMAVSANPIEDLNFAVNVPQDIKSLFIKSLSQVKDLKVVTPTPLHQKLYGNGGSDYVSYLTRQIKVIGYDSAEYPTGYVMYAKGLSAPGRMTITSQFNKFPFTPLWITNLSFHETRHLDSSGDYWHHSPCPKMDLDGKQLIAKLSKKPLEGLPNCDEESLGAFGATAVMMLNIAANCQSCSKQVRQEARELGVDNLKHVINSAARKQIIDDICSNVAARTLLAKDLRCAPLKTGGIHEKPSSSESAN